MKYLGDLTSQQTLTFTFNTHVNGTPTTLGGTPSLAVYKAGSTTQTTTGATLTADFDSVTGLNHVSIATTDSFYTAGGDYRVVIAAGTVGGNSVVGVCVGEFSIENRNIKANVTQVNGTTASDSDGTAQAGASSTITLASTASSVDDAYVGWRVWTVSGTGSNQWNVVTAYNGTTKVATVRNAWGTNPDSTTQYRLDPPGSADVEYFGGTAGDFNAGLPGVNLKTIDGTTAAYVVLGDSAFLRVKLSALNGSDAGDQQQRAANLAEFFSSASVADWAALAEFIGAIKAKTTNLPASPAATGDIPSAAAIASAVMASTADGDSLTTHLTNLRAMAQGVVSVTDNGDGTYTLAFKRADGTTTAFSKTYNPTTGARS